MYKRFENSGILLLGLYRICFKHFLATLKKNYSGAAPDDMVSKLCTFVTKTVKNNLATGTWGIQKNAYVRHGVAQVLSRLSYIGTLSHLQRIGLPVRKEGKNAKVRMIHPSELGFICLYETPEGKTCGIVLNMTICARITRHFSTNYTRDLFLKMRLINAEPSLGSTELWINNTLRYFVSETSFMEQFNLLRSREVIPKYINVYKERALNIIYVFSDGGRITRPLYNRQGQVTWLDAAESQSVEIGMHKDESPRFAYVEIHPCLLYGISAGCIPFSDHMQSPRNVYEASMIKQALGFFASSYARRYDSSFELMETVQRTLISTSIARAIGCPEMPAGVNCVVGIMTGGSWNAEDSLIINQGAIDRGLFRSTTFKTVTVEEYKPDSAAIKLFCLPDRAIRNLMLNYSLLDENGIIRAGSYVQKKDVIIGRVLTTKTGPKDVSEIADEEGIVDRVEVFRNVNGYRSAKIILKNQKIPERGDKFANMCAQKGTGGIILPQVDMPFTMDGISPDILINPNAFPSRMTISMFLEMVLGKHCALSGEFGDATPFSSNSTNIAKTLEGLLRQHGYDDEGWEMMMSGTTGEPFKTRIFVGISYYQKLKHMVADKMHARPFGNVTTLTRQPPAGRSKDGGLRMGEMERDATLSSGASAFLTSRLFDRSDTFHIAVCNNCRVFSNHKDECHLCKSTELIWARLPFASKLLFQQLTACLIGTKFSAELL
jgi:DNA-directed RNA polymerase II subunit RPB2